MDTWRNVSHVPNFLKKKEGKKSNKGEKKEKQTVGEVEAEKEKGGEGK